MLAMVADAQTAASADPQAGASTARDLDAPISDQLNFPKWIRFGGQ
jgi:hypothetical protein